MMDEKRRAILAKIGQSRKLFSEGEEVMQPGPGNGGFSRY